jgi:hypothetical protein
MGRDFSLRQVTAAPQLCPTLIKRKGEKRQSADFSFTHHPARQILPLVLSILALAFGESLGKGRWRETGQSIFSSLSVHGERVTKQR